MRAPKKYRSADGLRRAFLFGKKFPIYEYTYVGQHGNDAAQTGLIDVDAFDPELQGKATEIIEQEFAPRYNWNDRAALRRVRRQIPHILFLGETAGDVGPTFTCIAPDAKWIRY